jgi:hypothetical protein
MGPDAIELIDQISLACRDHLVLENHLYISRCIRASVAIAMQIGNALAIVGNIAQRLCEVDMGCGGSLMECAHEG